MTATDFVKAQLVNFAWGEAAYTGSLANVEAVACILANRVRAGWYGDDWLATIAAAPVINAHRWQTPPEMRMEDDLLQCLLRDIDDIFQGQHGDDVTSGRDTNGRTVKALYWAFTDRPILDNFAVSIIRRRDDHPQIVTLGGGMLLFA
jgi:hypothetical protein